jgi:REP element-mobilizing transposase RayT
MTNHIHFLVTPEHADSISRATSVIGSRYAWYYNQTYKLYWSGFNLTINVIPTLTQKRKLSQRRRERRG